MKVISGTVVGGKVDVPEGALAEGDRVAIVVAEHEEPIQLTTEQEAELVTAVEDIRNGKYLARISHRWSTASPQTSVLAALRSVGLLDVRRPGDHRHGRPPEGFAVPDHGETILDLVMR